MRIAANGSIPPTFTLALQRQCELLQLARSTYYHRPAPESPEDLRLMRQIDEVYLAHPFYGSHAQRLMRLIGIEAHYPKPLLSQRAPGHTVYPYLLRGLTIERPNHV